jgi:hypothetical protein
MTLDAAAYGNLHDDRPISDKPEVVPQLMARLAEQRKARKS